MHSGAQCLFLPPGRRSKKIEFGTCWSVIRAYGLKLCLYGDLSLTKLFKSPVLLKIASRDNFLRILVLYIKGGVRSKKIIKEKLSPSLSFPIYSFAVIRMSRIDPSPQVSIDAARVGFPAFTEGQNIQNK